MSYCVNLDCPQPQNQNHVDVCQACNSQLLLRHRYRLLKVLSQGEFAVTFLAQDESKLGAPICVIKQLRPATTKSHIVEMARVLFQREAETLMKIGDHPQIPQLLDYFNEHQQLYLVQEYINGLTLHEEIKQTGLRSQAEVKQFLSQFLPLLEFIHSQQVIHRDIKPANLIRRQEDGKLVLIDFGAVKNYQDDPDNIFGNSIWTENSIGTKGFAPPEQISMRPVYASDIFALGVTCIYLLTGKLPSNLSYSRSTCEMVWQEYVQISDHFAAILNKMLESAVRYRYQSAKDVLRALDS